MPRDWRRLQRLVDDKRVDELLTVVTPQEIAEAWTRYHRADRDSFDDPDWWAIELWMTQA